jgi:DNA-binding response OmpR family regulator
MDDRIRGIRIMVVDDEHDLTLFYRMSLEYHGFEVEAFNDPSQALSNFKTGYYDLIILDIKMPNMDGFEFASRILEQDVNVRVCFVTAKEINIQALKEQRPSLSLGCFIKKPITIKELVSRVKVELE